MVLDQNEFRTKKGELVKLKQRLNCKDYGIYAGQCVVCKHLYVGQTVTSFNIRWNKHRDAWRKGIKGSVIKNSANDEQALYTHYSKFHQNKLKNLKFWDAYQVIFIEKPSPENIDVAESYWINKLNAKINIIKSFLPRTKIDE